MAKPTINPPNINPITVSISVFLFISLSKISSANITYSYRLTYMVSVNKNVPYVKHVIKHQFSNWKFAG